MLSWLSEPQQHGRHTFTRTEVEAATPDVVAGLWTKVLDLWDATPPDQKKPTLIIELTTQIGTLSIYPADGKTVYPDDGAFCVDMRVIAWAASYDALPGPDESETDFDRAYKCHVKSIIDSVKAGISNPSIGQRFRTLKRSEAGFAIFFADEGGSSIHDRKKYLWGHKPPRTIFSSDIELFEHVFRKAETSPKYSMRIRNGVVDAVHWSGNEFRDSYVGLLEAVPDIARLCTGLRHFLLSVTKVTPSGIERLKRLFPNTEFHFQTFDEWSSRLGRSWEEDLL